MTRPILLLHSALERCHDTKNVPYAMSPIMIDMYLSQLEPITGLLKARPRSTSATRRSLYLDAAIPGTARAHHRPLIVRMPRPFLEEDLVAEMLFDEPFQAIAGARSRWAHRRQVELAELVHEPWVLPPYDSIPGASISKSSAPTSCNLQGRVSSACPGSSPSRSSRAADLSGTAQLSRAIQC